MWQICVWFPFHSGGRSKVAEDQKDTRTSCSDLRSQSSMVDVYARFTVTDEHAATRYLLHQKAKFLVTDVVRPLLQIADESVARLRDSSVIDAVEPGQTSVQVTRFFPSFFLI